MSELHKRRVFALVFVTVVAAIALPVVFGLPRGIAGQAGDGWRNFIYDFQTLIGGGAAIAAAWYTVREMRVTEKKSDDRHRQMMKLQLRADELLIERLLLPQYALIEAFMRKLKAIDLVRPQGPISGELTAEQRLAASKVDDAIKVLKEMVLGSPGWEEAKHLFGGELAKDAYVMKLKLELCRRYAALCRYTIELDLENAYDEDDEEGKISAIEDERTAHAFGWLDLCAAKPDLLRSVQTVLDGLRQLARTYEMEDILH